MEHPDNSDGSPLQPAEDSAPDGANSVIHGGCIGFLVLIINTATAMIPGGVFVAFFPGVSQWLVVIPLAIVWRRAKRFESVKGLLIFASVVSLANAACCGLLIYKF